MELIEQDSVMMLTTSITSSTRMCPVLSDTTVTYKEIKIDDELVIL
jgi:hypothetical protein